jgi:hypothetical protein
VKDRGVSVWLVLAAAGLAVVVAASVTAVVTLGVPSMQGHPNLGLVISAVTFLMSFAAVLTVLKRQK